MLADRELANAVEEPTLVVDREPTEPVLVQTNIWNHPSHILLVRHYQIIGIETVQ